MLNKKKLPLSTQSGFEFILQSSRFFQNYLPDGSVYPLAIRFPISA